MQSRIENSSRRTSRFAVLAIGMAALLLQAPQLAEAQSQSSTKSQAQDQSQNPSQSDKLDVTDLEKKYWAAKDSDFSVVQNRLFSKAGRFALTGNYGGFINDPWSEGASLGVALNYFFTERYGMELNWSKSDSKDNQATESLKTNQGGAPNHGKVKSFYGAAFNWVPFYAKMSVVNSSIIYFDMSVSAGVGITEYEQQMVESNVVKTAPTVTLDVTQHFFLSKWFALRFDYKNRWFQEEITQYRAPLSGVRTNTTDLNQTSLLMLGATLYF